MTSWGDSKKFWAETMRTVILGAAGACAAAVILAHVSEIDKTQIDIRAKVIDDFLTSSHKYTAVAYDACRGDANAMVLFEGKAVDDYRSALNRLKVYFGTAQLAPQLSAVDEEHQNNLHTLCVENGGPSQKEKWNPVRRDLEKANNDLAAAALKMNDLDPDSHQAWLKRLF